MIDDGLVRLGRTRAGSLVLAARVGPDSEHALEGWMSLVGALAPALTDFPRVDSG